MSTSAEPLPRLTIRPPSRWAPLRLNEVWEFRDLLVRFARRDITLRYRQTALGMVWVVLQPLLAAGIFSFVFGKVANLASDGVPYFAFSFAGMLAWNVFNSTVSKFATSLVSNAGLISKIFFPRLVLPLATVGSTLLDFVVSAGMMAAILVVVGRAPAITVLLVPIYLLLLVALASGIGLTAAALTVKYRDVGYIVPVVMQMALYATPIAYAASSVPKSARFWVQLNPLTGLIAQFRAAVLRVPGPSAVGMIWPAIAAIGSLTIGVLVFTRMEREFADVI